MKSLFQQLLKYVFLVKGSLTIPLKMIPSANVEIRQFHERPWEFVILGTGPEVRSLVVVAHKSFVDTVPCRQTHSQSNIQGDRYNGEQNGT